MGSVWRTLPALSQLLPEPLLPLAKLRNVPIQLPPDIWLPVSLAQRAPFRSATHRQDLWTVILSESLGVCRRWTLSDRA